MTAETRMFTTDESARRRVWIAAIAFLVCLAATVIFALFELPPPGRPEDEGSPLVFLGVALLFPIAGFLILWRQPRNRVGWILVAIGFAWVEPLASFGTFALSRGIPGGAVAATLSGGTWAPPIVLTGSVLLLRFPNGELLSLRWRKVEWLAIGTMVAIVLSIALYPGTLEDLGYPGIRNPLEIPGVSTAAEAVLPFALFLFPVLIILSAVNLVIRYRRSRGAERLQMKWLTTAAATVASIYGFGMLVSVPNAWGTGSQAGWVDVLDTFAFLSFALIPSAIVAAVLRYRLYEVDVVINKAIVYGALAAFVTSAYVGIVVGLGRAVGSDRSLPLQVAATVVVAVAFQPLRERVQRFANRLVYGRRATPYQVLAGFAEQVAGSYATDEIASAVARLLIDGTGAKRAEIWLRTDGEPRLAATWPPGDPGDATALPEGDELTRAVPVVHRGETLGDLVIRKAANDPVGPNDEKLLADVAGQAGLVFRNVRLIDDLRASRQRLVAARDTERRKLERNIHDGAQQRLVALAVLYNMAAGLAKPLGEDHHAAIADLGGQAQSALETLRDLARGIYPAVLSDSGVVAALQSHGRKSPMPVEVIADGIGRYPQDVEATVYFCCSEALQNVAKYAQATNAIVRLEDRGDEIRFDVEDDGVGFDVGSVERGLGTRNMEDRLSALGGGLEVRSARGRGTSVSGRVPVTREAPVLAAVG